VDETAALGEVPVARRNRRAFPQKSKSTLFHQQTATARLRFYFSPFALDKTPVFAKVKAE